jgi:hypothetical protein
MLVSDSTIDNDKLTTTITKSFREYLIYCCARDCQSARRKSDFFAIFSYFDSSTV